MYKKYKCVLNTDLKYINRLNGNIICPEILEELD